VHHSRFIWFSQHDSHLYSHSILVTPLRGTNIALTCSARWNTTGITVAGDPSKGNATNKLWFPTGLYIDDNQTIFVADNSNHRIMSWPLGAKEGQLVAGGNGEGSLMTQLNSPLDVIMDPKTKDLLICDGTNNRVVRWPPYGGTRGELVLPNITCQSLTMDNRGFLYVSDREKLIIRRFLMNGEIPEILVTNREKPENGNKQLKKPQQLFIDQNYTIYVADQHNHYVIKWIEGNSEGLRVAGDNRPGRGGTQLNNPSGVVVDNMGTVYVADRRNNRIVRWCANDTQGTIIAGVSGFGNAPHQLNEPVALSFDRQGNLYVVDQMNNRIQKFELLFK
jgi:sugar lactone lactonase YvrE